MALCVCPVCGDFYIAYDQAISPDGTLVEYFIHDYENEDENECVKVDASTLKFANILKFAREESNF